jgi:hypothetical protein
MKRSGNNPKRRIAAAGMLSPEERNQLAQNATYPLTENDDYGTN